MTVLPVGQTIVSSLFLGSEIFVQFFADLITAILFPKGDEFIPFRQWVFTGDDLDAVFEPEFLQVGTKLDL